MSLANSKCNRVACLPALRPVGSFLADMYGKFKEIIGQHKSGSELLLDMLPRRTRIQPTELPTISPPSSSRHHSTDKDSFNGNLLHEIGSQENELTEMDTPISMKAEIDTLVSRKDDVLALRILPGEIGGEEAFRAELAAMETVGVELEAKESYDRHGH